MPKAINTSVSPDDTEEGEVFIPDDRSDNLMNRLFDSEQKIEKPVRGEEEEPGEDPGDSENEDLGKNSEEETEEETEEDSTDEEGEDDSEEDDGEEVDYDSPKEGDRSKESGKDTMAAKMAKENGRKVKELDAQLKEAKLELDKLREEREALAQEAEQLRSVKINPSDHPEYKGLRQEILEDVEQAAEVLPISNPSKLTRKFGEFMADYLGLTGLSGEKRAESLAKLRGKIVDEVSGEEIPYSEMDDDERRRADAVALDVLKVVQRNAGKTRNLQKLAADLQEKSEITRMTFGQKNYDKEVSEFTPILDSIGDLPEDTIEENPHHIESVVARMVKESPEARKRLEAAKRDALEILTGPRVLSRDELTKLESNGTDIKEFLKNREKAFLAKKKKLLPLIVQGLVTRSTFRETLAELAKMKDANKEEEVEFDALRKITKKKITKKPKGEEYVPAAKRQRPLDKLFGPGD